MMDVRQFWHVNTHHIAEADAQLLSNEAVLGVDETAESYWLRMPTNWGADLRDHLQLAGYTPAMLHLLSIAHSHNIALIRLSGDGPTYPFLNHFHW